MLVRSEGCSDLLVSDEFSIDCTSHRAAGSPAPCASTLEPVSFTSRNRVRLACFTVFYGVVCTQAISTRLPIRWQHRQSLNCKVWINLAPGFLEGFHSP